MRVLALLSLALLLPASLQAQTVRGRVYEHGTSSTIAGATIEAVGSKGQRVATTTDSTGYFVLYPASPGRLTVTATHPSYVLEHADTVSVNAKETVTMVVRMTRQAIAIAPIVVTARSASALGGFYERQRRNAFGRFVDEQEIARRRPVDFAQLLRGQPGLEVEDSFGSSQILLRGSFPDDTGYPRCAAGVYVDGMPMAGGMDLESLVPLSRVAAVEIYPDATGVPFEFTTIGRDCGVVAFWTHPVRDGRVITWKRVGIASVLIGAVILVQRLIMGSSQSDIADRETPDLTMETIPFGGDDSDPVWEERLRFRFG